jgi:hypothetical protein
MKGDNLLPKVVLSVNEMQNIEQIAKSFAKTANEGYLAESEYLTLATILDIYMTNGGNPVSITDFPFEFKEKFIVGACLEWALGLNMAQGVPAIIKTTDGYLPSDALIYARKKGMF